MRHAVDQFIDQSTPASRCLVPVFVATPVLLIYLIGHALALQDPLIRPALRVPVMWGLELILAVAGAVFVVAGWWLWPRRHLDHKQPVASTAVALSVGVSYVALSVSAGSFTAGPNLVMLGALVNGLLLFNRTTMRRAFWVSAALLWSAELAVMAGVLPYAPALNAGAFVGDSPQWWWALWRDAVFYVGLVVILVMVIVLFARLEAVHQKLNRLTYTDVLTGVANRRFFMDRLAREVRRHQRLGHPLTMILLDADHFKQVNDQHGHPAGDAVLVRLATLMTASLRGPTDLVARLGGEEFGVLLPGASLEHAHMVCSRIQEALAQEEFQGSGASFRVTVSMGLAQCEDACVQSLVQEADRQLYRAKVLGRNRWVSAQVLESVA